MQLRHCAPGLHRKMLAHLTVSLDSWSMARGTPSAACTKIFIKGGAAGVPVPKQGAKPQETQPPTGTPHPPLPPVQPLQPTHPASGPCSGL